MNTENKKPKATEMDKLNALTKVLHLFDVDVSKLTIGEAILIKKWFI